MFRAPRADELEVMELEEARKALLQAQTQFEYTGAIVRYNTERVVRLEASVARQLEHANAVSHARAANKAHEDQARVASKNAPAEPQTASSLALVS